MAYTPEQFAKAMEQKPVEMFRGISNALIQRARLFTSNTFVKARLSGAPGLNARTGALRRSFTVAASGSDFSNWRLVEYSTSKYANLHEKGGIITPKSSKYLAIPLNKTAAGVSRGNPRSYANAFFITSKKGNLLLVQRNGNSITPLFIMKKSVTIPARLGFQIEWQRDQPQRMAAISKVVEGVLAGGSK